jgi:hypothetical protein
LQRVDSFIDVGHQQAVGDKTSHILRHGRRLGKTKIHGKGKARNQTEWLKKERKKRKKERKKRKKEANLAHSLSKSQSRVDSFRRSLETRNDCSRTKREYQQQR